MTCIIHSRNYFTQKGIISKRLGSNTILLVNPNPDFNMKITFFRYYAIVYTGIKNNLICRSIPEIVLRESRKDGEHLFMYLYTGKEIHIYEWMELLIYYGVVKRVEEL